MVGKNKVMNSVTYCTYLDGVEPPGLDFPREVDVREGALADGAEEGEVRDAHEPRVRHVGALLLWMGRLGVGMASVNTGRGSEHEH